MATVWYSVIVNGVFGTLGTFGSANFIGKSMRAQGNKVVVRRSTAAEIAHLKARMQEIERSLYGDEHINL